ncbi:YceD family protein [Azospirillum sp. sgz301742]
MQNHVPPPEFSRLVKADSVQQRGEVVEVIEADEAERTALAARFELEAIGRLKATVRLTRTQGGEMVRAVGELEADVVQTCVVTLESVHNSVKELFESLFAPPALVPDTPDDMDFDASIADEDIIEPIVNGRIDIGELTAQHLSLALDPYPRCPGVEVPEELRGDEDEVVEERPNPFAALGRLKGSQQEG